MKLRGAGPHPALHSQQFWGEAGGSAYHSSLPRYHTEHSCSWIYQKSRLVWDHPREWHEPHKAGSTSLHSCCGLLPGTCSRMGGQEHRWCEGKKERINCAQSRGFWKADISFASKLAFSQLEPAEKGGRVAQGGLGAKSPIPGRVGRAKHEVSTRAGWPWFLLGAPRQLLQQDVGSHRPRLVPSHGHA